MAPEISGGSYRSECRGCWNWRARAAFRRRLFRNDRRWPPQFSNRYRCNRHNRRGHPNRKHKVTSIPATVGAGLRPTRAAHPTAPPTSDVPGTARRIDVFRNLLLDYAETIHQKKRQRSLHRTLPIPRPPTNPPLRQFVTFPRQCRRSQKCILPCRQNAPQ